MGFLTESWFIICVLIILTVILVLRKDKQDEMVNLIIKAIILMGLIYLASTGLLLSAIK